METETRGLSRGLPRLSRDNSKWLIWVLISCGLVLLITFLLWRSGAESRALRAMEPERRAVLYQESLSGYLVLCTQDPGGIFTHRCREQAHFLRRFPECDEACRAQTSLYLEQGTR